MSDQRSRPPKRERVRIHLADAFLPPDVARPLNDKLERIAVERPELAELIARITSGQAP